MTSGRGGEPPQLRQARRDEYAEQTREAVIASARKLFASRGFVSTTVNEIAEMSRVSSGTVYQQCGGKQGLLRTLLRSWTDAPLMHTMIEGIDSAMSGAEVLEALADAHLEMYLAFHEIVRLSVATAPHDEDAARSLREVNDLHRGALVTAAQKLRALGLLSDTSDDDFADIATFYFGTHNGIPFLVNDLGWAPTRARNWIARQFARSVGVSSEDRQQ